MQPIEAIDRRRADAVGYQSASHAIRDLLERALAGDTLSACDGYRLAQAEGVDALAVRAAAGALRDRHKGRRVTYSRKVFLPVTNLCVDRCSYCTFRKDPEEPGAWTMRPDEIARLVERGSRLGCKEALMCLGDKPERAFPGYRRQLRAWGYEDTVDYLRQACAIALAGGLLPHTNAGLLSRDEMRLLRPVNVSMGLMLENISPRLRERGMAHHRAPDKDPRRRLQMLIDAGELCVPFTTGILVGIGETMDERVDSLCAIREVHAAYGHIQEVIIQNFRAKPGTALAGASGPSVEEHVQTVAVARLLLGGEMNIQAPPNLSMSGHRWLLRAGINDWGGISPVTRDYVNPEAPWPDIDALARTCQSEGFTLAERLAIYPEYVERRGFLGPELVERVATVSAALARLTGR